MTRRAFTVGTRPIEFFRVTPQQGEGIEDALIALRLSAWDLERRSDAWWFWIAPLSVQQAGAFRLALEEWRDRPAKRRRRARRAKVVERALAAIPDGVLPCCG